MALVYADDSLILHMIVSSHMFPSMTILFEYWIFDSDECDICYVSCIWYAKAIPKGADNCAWLVVLVFGAIDDHLYFGVIV